MNPALPLALLALLQAQPKGSEDVFSALQRNAWYLETRDHAAALYVTELGKGEPVVFLHGGPGNDFHYIVDALRPHLDHHRFILFDQRGSLLSPVGPRHQDTLTFDKVLEDLEQLREAQGLERLTLFGHSFGSLVALAYHRKYPGRVKSLILCGSVPPDLPQGIQGLMKALKPRQAALLDRPEAIASVCKAEGLPLDPHQDTPRQASLRHRISRQAPLVILDLRRWREVTGGGVYCNDTTAEAMAVTLTGDLNFSASLKAHPVPITVLQGDGDFLCGSAPWWDLARTLPTVWVHPLSQAGHFPWIDAPTAFHAGLKAALEGSPERPRARQQPPGPSFPLEEPTPPWAPAPVRPRDPSPWPRSGAAPASAVGR